MKNSAIILVLLLFGTLSAGAQVFPNSPEPWRAEYEISLKDFKFSHPGTVISEDELVIIRKRILYDIEPQKTAFKQLMEQADAALAFTPYAPQILEIPGGYVDPYGLEYARNLLWANCHAAYSCALVYAITGVDLYAEKAVEVLMHWAKKGTTFYGNDDGLQLGSYFSPMLYAADLLYNYPGWNSDDRNLFKSWWRNNCLIDGDVLGLLRRDVIEQYYAWDVKNEPFPWNSSPKKSDKRRNAYELANLKYDFSAGFKTYIQQSRPIIGREGDEYITLNKGDMTGVDTIPATAPTNLTAEAISSTKINLTWADNSTNEYGFKIKRSTGQGFILIDSCSSGTEFYHDTGLVAGVEYFYRVYGFNASVRSNYSNEDTATTFSVTSFPIFDDLEETIIAYPNPFIEIISNRFRVNKPAKVSLIIYNGIGQQMVQLKNGNLDNGWHQVEWDGTDSKNNKVPAGIYFCNFQIGSHRHNIPIMLIE